MGAALSIFVLLSLSVLVIRVAAVALRLTGMSEASSRFQALSAFSGTGFTTSEAETVVNYPIRRRIVSVLMIIGNLGLVTVFATLVVSLVQTDGNVDAIVLQLSWLLGGLAMLWFLMLNKTADRIMCSLIGKILKATTFLGKRKFQRLLQVSNGYSICEHPVTTHLLNHQDILIDTDLVLLGLSVLAVRTQDGKLTLCNFAETPLCLSDTLIVFGKDAGHEALGCDTCQFKPESDESKPTFTNTK